MINETNVTLMVTDMEKSIQFYTKTLGLRLKANYGGQFAQIEAPGTIIALHPIPENGPKPGYSEGISIGFGVVNLEETMEELRQRGVEFSRTSDDNQVMLAFFTDPDGYHLYLSQSKWG